MNTFAIHLESASQYERFDGVESFTGVDASGSFGLLAGHSRFMTMLSFGLSRFRTSSGDLYYLALPGGLVRFVENQLHISTRRYLRGADYEQIRASLQEQFAAEEADLHSVKQSLARLEREMFRRLLEIERGQYG
jgi:F-type H+-transporting ATPase subunit epsilon